MGRVLGLAVAAVMVVAGVIWTLQGLGTIGGSAMSGQSFWAVAGPAVAGLGVALGFVVLTGRQRRR
jgi:hypothetical protein